MKLLFRNYFYLYYSDALSNNSESMSSRQWKRIHDESQYDIGMIGSLEKDRSIEVDRLQDAQESWGRGSSFVDQIVRRLMFKLRTKSLAEIFGELHSGAMVNRKSSDWIHRKLPLPSFIRAFESTRNSSCVYRQASVGIPYGDFLWGSIPTRVFKGERCQGFVSIEMRLGLKREE